MSTNFYLHIGEEIIHIGKRFAAGGGDISFIFYAATFDSQIKEWRQWRNTLACAEVMGGIISDDYSGPNMAVTFDTFRTMIETIPEEKRGRQNELQIQDGTLDDKSWMDGEGYCFSDYEFC